MLETGRYAYPSVRKTDLPLSVSRESTIVFSFFFPLAFNIWTWNADVFVGTDILKLRKAQTSLASANNKKKQKQDLSLVVTLHSGWFISDS